MIVPLVVTVWIVTLWLVAGLCASARLGDVDSHTDAAVAAGGTGPGSLGWEHLEISAHANARSGHPVESGGIAA